MAIQISTPQDLDNIRNDLYGDYELVNDIDMSGWGNWNPVEIFFGTFNGNGYIISNLTINTTKRYSGLFGRLNNATIIKLGIENVNIQSTAEYVGGLVGSLESKSYISECYVTGRVRGRSNVGGLVGSASGNSTLINNYTICDVGGGGEVNNVIGGLIGQIDGVNIRYNYSASTISANIGYRGSFYGYIRSGSTNSYANNFLDGTIGYGNTGGSAIKSVPTSQMMQQATFQNWDFENVWGINEGESYPYLLAFQEPEPQLEERFITSYINKIHSNVNIDVNLPPKSVNIDVNSHISSISSSIYRYVSTLINVEGYLSPIHSNVTTSVKTTHKGLRNVTSYINTLNTNVVTQIYRQPLKVSRDVTSYVKPIYAYTDVLTDIKTIPIIAYSGVIANPSSSTFIANQSYCEVVK